MPTGIPAILALGCTSVTLLLAFVGMIESGRTHSPTDPTPHEETIDTLYRISPSVISGAEPGHRQAFTTLRRLGVRTIVSVDGSRPDVASARRHGLRYVHIPIGYDGVPPPATKMLTRVMRDCARPMFVHCHHGKHRGPAAAAICAIIAGECDQEAALEFLERVGTSRDYAGLWRDVGAFQPLPAHTQLPPLVAVAETVPLVEAMVHIDGIFESLVDAVDADAAGQSGSQRDSRILELSILLEELFHEALRLQGRDPAQDLQRQMRMAEQAAASLMEAARNHPNEVRAATHALRSICNECHRQYRN